ncbi:hypothetical protein HGRIS_005667 [Hohenbuehelia grisea]|uniref:Wings apart-like protein C-terminal domain-containing protein n=1 Tax=Hohenbuehelia grisea TaxID=104357 RepID=A0ABR3JZD8_9AGAR
MIILKTRLIPTRSLETYNLKPVHYFLLLHSIWRFSRAVRTVFDMKRTYAKRKQPSAEGASNTPAKRTKLPAGKGVSDEKPSSSPKSARTLSRSHTEPSVLTSTPSLPQTPTRTRTYAGSSRSFLVEMPLELDASSTEQVPRESYTALRVKWGLDNDELDEREKAPFLASRDSKEAPSPSKRSKTSSPVKSSSKALSRTSSLTSNSIPPAPVSAPVLPNGMMNDLKSITDLRSKGQSRRFLDEVGYIFEGMHSSCASGLRRASALELVQKLCDREFAQKARAADFYGRALDVFYEAGAGKGEDKILDTFLLAFLALVSRDVDALVDLSTRPPPDVATNASSSNTEINSYISIPLMLLTLLSSMSPNASQDASAVPHDALAASSSPLSLAELKRAGISKSDKASLTALHDTLVNRSGMFSSGVQLSSALLASYVLRVLASLDSHSFLLPKLSILQTHSYPSLIFRSCQAALKPFKLDLRNNSNRNSKTHASSQDAPSVTEFMHVTNCLYILDTLLQGDWDAVGSDEEATEGLELLDGLVMVAVVSETVVLQHVPDESQLLEDDDEDGDSGSRLPEIRYTHAQECAELVLRVLTRFTQGERGSSSSSRAKPNSKGKEKMKARELGWTMSIAAHDLALAHIMRAIVRSHDNMCVAPKAQEKPPSNMSSKRKAPLPPSKVKLEDRGASTSGKRTRTSSPDGSRDPASPNRNGRSVGARDDDGVEDNLRKRAEALDRLCLGLALLTNVIHGACSSASRSLQEICLSHLCKLSTPCLRTCACSKPSMTALESLYEIYTCHLERRPPVKNETPPPAGPSEAEVNIGDPASFLCGHLAIVFGMLIRDSPTVREKGLKELAQRVGLPTLGSKRQQESAMIRQLIEQARRFVAFYQSVLSVTSAEAGVPSSRDPELGDGAAGADDVATEVIRGLEQLLKDD